MYYLRHLNHCHIKGRIMILAALYITDSFSYIPT